MKSAKILYFILLLIALITLETKGQSLSGSGTSADPYLIYDADDLRDMDNYNLGNEDLYFSIEQDLDLSSYPNWTPLYSGYDFKCVLRGNNHIISNMNISDNTTSGTNRYGLIWNMNITNGHSEANIHNIIFSNCSIVIEKGYVGFVTGKCGGADFIEYIYVDSTCVIDVGANGDDASYVGSIVGYSGHPKYCYSEATIVISRSSYVGGITGTTGADIIECGFDGKIIIDDSQGVVGGYFGGIVGEHSGTGYNIKDCFVLGRYSSMPNAYFGGQEGRNYNAKNTTSYSCFDSVGTSFYYNGGDIIGLWNEILNNDYGTGYSINDVFFVKKLNGYYARKSDSEAIQPNDTNGTQITLEQLKDTTFLSSHNWDFVNTWIVGERFNGKPYLQWMDNLVPPPNNKMIRIIEPSENDNFSLGDSITVRFESEKIDSVLVNGDTVIVASLALDTTVTKVYGTPSGTFPIVVKELNGIKQDSISVNIIGDTQLSIDTAKVVNRIATITCTNSLHLDSLRFYVGLDTNNMQYLGEGIITSLSQDYSFPLPNNFYVSGNYWYKVLRDVDTSTSIKSNGEIKFMGIPKAPSGICWYNKDRSLVGIDRLYDAGCGWVNNITYGYYNYLLRTDLINTTDSLFWKYRYKSCTIEDRQNPATNIYCNNAAIDYKVFTKDTTYGNIDSAVVLHMSEFNEVAPFTYGNRRYYLYNGAIYADDLVHNIDSILVKRFDKDYLNEESVAMSILRYEVPNHNDTLRTDGTLSGRRRALTKLKHPFFILTQENNGWSYYADVPDTTYSLIQDKYQATGKVNFYRSQFRGVHPKATKTAVPPYNNFGN